MGCDKFNKACKDLNDGFEDWEKKNPLGSKENPYPDEEDGLTKKEADKYRRGEYDDVEAKNGFSGLITKPTRFLVGEDGAEFVSVTPHKKNRPIMDLGLEMMNNTRLPRKKGKNQDFNFDMGNIMGGSSKKKKKSTNPFDFNFF